MNRFFRLGTFDFAKRLFDVLGAGAALILLLPVLLVVGLLVAATLGRPVLFTQPRPGMSGRVFTLYKFRTMRDVDPTRSLETDEERITSFGAALRSTSLDELPSLWNVLKGDMSIVGPRPLLVRYLDRYTAEQYRRHEVRPGITGLAQVSGRNTLSWEAKFARDVEYVDSRSWRVDLAIIAETVRTVARREGVSAEGEVTMTEFMGNSIDESSSVTATPVLTNQQAKGKNNG